MTDRRANRPRSSAARQMWAALLGVLFGVLHGIAWLPAPARADTRPIAGAEAPGFLLARAAWLEDDEAGALSQLGELARQGNAAAQVLIGLIDKSPWLQGPWLAQLDRGERISLMRAPGGLSGRSWLTHAADEPLAATWLAILRPDGGPEVGAAFAAMNEHRAARDALATLAAREHPGLGSVWGDWMDLEMAFVLWPRADDALRARIDAAVPPDHPQRGLMGGVTLPGALDRWLAESPATAALRHLCASECPQSQNPCRAAAYAALGSHIAVLTVGSPAETLIPQDEFLASPRGRSAILRRMLLTADARGRRALIQRAEAGDSCLGVRLALEELRYRPTVAGNAPRDG
jgi:hypothetical protein